MRIQLRAKKSLGQHFLTSVSALQAIVEAGELTESDTILEIGPGKGELTTELLIHGVKVIAVEKDRKLVVFLKKKFEKEVIKKQLTLVEEDILRFTINKKYKIVAN